MRHPGLFARWLPFGGKLLAGRLPARDRELLVLRTGWRCRSEYEWAQHVVVGRAAGLTDEEIERVVAGPDAPGWDPFEAVLLRASNGSHPGASGPDATRSISSSVRPAARPTTTCWAHSYSERQRQPVRSTSSTRSRAGSRPGEQLPAGREPPGEQPGVAHEGGEDVLVVPARPTCRERLARWRSSR